MSGFGVVMFNSHNQKARNRPANLCVNRDSHNKAKLSQAWISENQSAIAAYNQNVEQNGVFSDYLSCFVLDSIDGLPK